VENLDLAVKYGDLLLNCTDLKSLALISSDIRARLNELKGFEGWLRDMWWSAKTTLSAPNRPIEDIYNKEGLKALKKGLI
jgi:hypothetical protein